jgi:TPR repeat protein/uncharacterized caspase-like protein
LRRHVIAALLLGVVATAPAAAEPRRLALVVGNANYQHAPVLENAANDGRDMARTLSGLDFAVVDVLDANLPTFNASLRTFSTGIAPGDIVVIFYAGHGAMGVASESSDAFDNFLIPVDAALATPDRVPVETVGLHGILRLLDRAGAGPRIVILDACRDNPFSDEWPRATVHGAVRGLMQPTASALTNVYVAFAAAPGNTASDNADGKNGLFTQEVLKRMGIPGLTITALMEQASAAVEFLSQGAQRPWFAAGGGEAPNLVIHPNPGQRRAVADTLTLDLRVTRDAFECGLSLCLESAAADVRSPILKQELQLRARVARAASQPSVPGPPAPLPLPPAMPPSQPPAARSFMDAHRASLAGWVQIADRLMAGKDGFVKDETSALGWYRAAALAGSGEAAFNVGSAFHRGLGGVPFDPVEALRWFRRAADRGYPQAYGMLGQYSVEGAASQPKSEADAVTWFRRGHDHGDGVSTRRLADLTFSGAETLKKDPAAAQQLYLEAAQVGDPEAMYRVSMFMLFTRGRADRVLRGSDADAIAWLKGSAELGYLPAYGQLALDYHLGQELAKDNVQALQWLLRAADRGSKEAMVSIGKGYAAGDYGLGRDCHQAGRWLRRAQVAGSRDALLELFSVAPACESYL